MTGHCVNCGKDLPPKWVICSECRAFINSIAHDGSERIRCILCQEKARKILLHTNSEFLGDVAWGQCEGTFAPNHHCMLWNAALEADFEARNKPPT